MQQSKKRKESLFWISRKKNIKNVKVTTCKVS